jgi:hypothetical protein
MIKENHNGEKEICLVESFIKKMRILGSVGNVLLEKNILSSIRKDLSGEDGAMLEDSLVKYQTLHLFSLR